jgi:hypothetical protein
MIPRILKPTTLENVLRPDGTGYNIEFKAVDLFNSYLITISKMGGRGDSVIIYSKCKSILNKETFLLNRSKFKDEVYCDYGSRLVFWISEDELATNCKRYEIGGEIVAVDPTCNCTADCLYQNKFSICVQGCVNGIDASEIPNSFVGNVEFQCNSKGSE